MKTRYLIVALALLLGPVLPASAQFSVNIGGAGFNIGVNMPVYPRLVLIPGYPVYYDPNVSANYFFYDGLYWVFSGDNWYASSWYNGPWDVVPPEAVPQFLLLVPVRYYRAPPIYFRSWYRDGPPRWGEHWGHTWEQRRVGWDHWDRRSVPAAAPLPVYQRQYSGSRYPRAVQQQQVIQSQNYRYQPRDAVAQQHFREGARAPARAQTAPAMQQGQPPQNEQRARGDRQQHQVQQQQQPVTQSQQARQARPASTPVPNGGEPQAKGGENRGAPREMRAAPQGPGPQAQNRGAPHEVRAAPQGPAPQARAESPHGKAENHGAQQEARGNPEGKGAHEGKAKEENKE